MKYISKLTKNQEAQMEKYRDKCIKIGLKTGKTDFETFDKYMPICYEKAGFKYPKNVVRVKSPLVGALSASIARAIIKKQPVNDAVSDAVDSVDDAVRDVVSDSVDGAVRDAVSDAVDGAVHGVVDSVDGAVSDAVDGAVRDAVRDAVDSVDGAVRDAVDGAVRDAVSDAVDSVDDAVRDAVRDAVSDAVDSVDDAVRDAVRDAVNGAVRDLDIRWHYWLGGQFWVGGWYWGVSFVNFFFNVCNLKLDKDIMERAEAYRKVCESVNYIWPNKSFIIVCERPVRIEKNNNNQLHSLTDMAIKYPDGWGLYMIDGVRFEKEWWEKISQDKLSAEEVFAIDNIEHRRIAYQYMDKTKMSKLKNYKVLDEVEDDGHGKKMRIVSFNVQNMDDDLIFLNCFCPTTNREYYIQTKETKCWDAKNQSFGLDNVEWVNEY